MDTVLNEDMLKKRENKIDVIMEATYENFDLLVKRPIEDVDDDNDNDKIINLKKIKKIPSQQILIPRTSLGHPPSTSSGCPLKILFEHPEDVPS